MTAFGRFSLFTTAFTLYAIFMLAPAAATLQELQAGMDIPDFSLNSVSGKNQKFADIRGERLTILFFWSTWSSNSARGLARMEKLYRLYGAKGLGVVGINADEQKIGAATVDKIKETIKNLNITFPVLIDQGLKAFHDIGVIALPTTVILDRDRVIRYELSGYPLVGSEEMADYVASVMDGKKDGETAAVKRGYQPDKEALRYYNMGKNTLKSRRMADKAETWFKKAIESDPGFVLPHLSLGRLYMQKGDIKAAKAEYEYSLAREPGNIAALCEMGMIAAEEGRLQEGLSFFDRTMKSDDSYTPCYYYRGYLLGRSGKMAEAMKSFDTALSINPMDLNIHLFKGRLFEEKGMMQQAAEEYGKALGLALNAR